MSQEESVETRQNNEFEALQAIYGEDLQDKRKKAAWNKWTPLNLSVSLTPQQGSSGTKEFYVKVDLHVICSVKYPQKAPQVLLENSKGLSDTVLTQLKDELDQKAEELEGDEMIFQLCQHVQEFLHRHNKPAMKSLYDEMLNRQKEKEMQEMQQRQIEENIKKEHMMKEVQQRREMLKAEAKLMRENYKKSGSENEGEDARLSRRFSSERYIEKSSTDSTEESICGHKGTVLLDFNGREVQRGQCLRHSLNSNSVTFIGLDTETGGFVEICHWSLRFKHNDLGQIQRQLASIEQEMNYVTKLKHPNLGHYLGFKSDIENDVVDVYVLKEFIYGLSCYSLYTCQHVKAETDALSTIARGVLHALEYLHRNNVVHKNLKDTCVFVNDKGLIKLSNYSINQRLSDLVSALHGNYGKKNDIYDFGRLLLGLSCPDAVQVDQEGQGDSLEVPDGLQGDILDLLTKCLSSEKERPTASQLLSHPFFLKKSVHFSPSVDDNHPIERNISPEIDPNIPAYSNRGDNGQSRINMEFEMMELLGKGAFGDVLKARNKLDGRHYAIKRIKLNPKSKALNKKIVREVTLLSRTLHENVVRYYNAWIETTTIIGDADEESSLTTTTTTTTASPTKNVKNNVPKIIARKNELSLEDDIEKLAPPMKNVEISITYDSKSQAPYASSSSSDDDDSSSDDDDDDEWAGPAVLRDVSNDSESIEFERDSNEEKTSSSNSKSKSVQDVSKKSTKETSNPNTNQELVREVAYMYIQMEFCEKSTLRTAIDNNLYQEENRVWRMFREIVEGLAYIHQQGMIHRDLKPVNIFLDSSDHVKIGDFGLATTVAIRSRQGDIIMSKSIQESAKEEPMDESKTGHVGTALYVAPEISSSNKAFYNQKVDIYSLGIILFEMCYHPLETGMERIKTLTRLRAKEIEIPEDFDLNNKRAHVLIRWLLNHDISKRPTSDELLQSPHIPPPVLEERKLQEMVLNTLNNPQLKGYMYLINSCFKQTLTPAQDITYDSPSVPVSSKPLGLFEFVKETCIKVFKKHGGENLNTPLFMPKSKYYENVESCVKVMTHFGNVVSIPHDLRVPFARYVAWNNITCFRRYAVERVYREKKAFGFIPREFYECAFDIVTPTSDDLGSSFYWPQPTRLGNLLSDAEIIYIVYEIINELPGVKNKPFLIRLNHTKLLKAILLHCGIKDKHEDVYKILIDIREEKIPKYQLQNILINRGLSDHMINLLINYLYSEYEVSKIVNQFQTITRKKSGEASQLAKSALQDLRSIIQNAEAYGVKFDIVIAPGMVYNVHQFSGMICQFSCDLKKKHKHSNKEVVAAGGRYDSMISYYRNIMEQTNMATKDIHQSAVGISLSLDKLVQAMQKAQEESEETLRVDPVVAIICATSCQVMVKEKTKIQKILWDHGITCFLTEEMGEEEIQDKIKALNVSHVIILKENEEGTIRVKNYDKEARERFQEKKYTISDLAENPHKIIRLGSDNPLENPQNVMPISRSESKSSYNLDKNDIDTKIMVDISIVSAEKVSSNARKRYENQVRSQLDGTFQKLSGFISVLAFTLESVVIGTLVSCLSFENESEFWKSVHRCIEKHLKHKQYLNEVCDEIWDVKCRKTNPSIILYSLPDNFYRVIL